MKVVVVVAAVEDDSFSLHLHILEIGILSFCHSLYSYFLSSQTHWHSYLYSYDLLSHFSVHFDSHSHHLDSQPATLTSTLSFLELS